MVDDIDTQLVRSGLRLLQANEVETRRHLRIALEIALYTGNIDAEVGPLLAALDRIRALKQELKSYLPPTQP